MEKQEIVNKVESLASHWERTNHGPGHGRDYMSEIYNLWKEAWDSGFVPNKSLSMDNLTEAVALRHIEKNDLSECPRSSQELLEEISLVWFAWTVQAEA